MATLSRAESKHMYSWWWDSHISPKNSKWLQQNLTDMDSKVKQMIKLIEVDEDSFARRAEMYYKRRPELMKQVEEFYRAYRALAERYDHATGVIRQAHRTMAEAFPNQVPLYESDSDARTPETPTPGRASTRDGNFTHESDSIAMEKGMKHGDDIPGEGRARRELNFNDIEKKDVTSGSETLERYETEIKALKEALANVEAEKEASLLQYQQNLQRLSNLEAEVSRSQDDSKVLREVASNAEAEVESLKESLTKLESEREANLDQYHKSLERISSLEANISRAQEEIESQEKRASEAEKESQLLKEELVLVNSEKEAGLSRYMEALEKIANLENKLSLAEDKVNAIGDRADNAEKEVDSLKQAMARISEEKEALALKYEKCLEVIAILEGRIALANEELEKLKNERDQAAARLKGAEEQCLLLERSNVSMKTELDSLVHRLGLQNEEISEKQKELGRLWTSVQEERLRFVEVESAFRTLQGLHSQTQEELRSAASELQKRVQLLKEMEIQNQSLQGEVQMVRDENRGLSEVNMSSAVSIKNLQDEIGSIRDEKAQLEGELELRLDQRNALQQEIYCLKEELKNLNKKHQSIMEQVESVGFLPECIGSSVKDLQDENSKLKERCQRSEAEILALLDKLSVMETLFEKNALLEKSLSELGAELDNARAKVKALEESCQLIMSEKSTAIADKAALISQLEITTQNLKKLSERNTFLENSLFDTNAELETLRATSKNLEESCLLLNDEKSVLVSEKQALELDLETAQRQLEELRTRHAELENNHSGMKDERESTLRLLEELSTSLDAEKQEHSNTSQISRQKIARLENQIFSLEKAGEKTRAELERELDNAMNAQLDIFILRNCMYDLREKNSALLLKCEKLLETSKLSEKLISELEYENIEQQEEVKFLTNQIQRLRMGMVQLLKALEVDLDCGYDEQELDEDQLILHRILVKLDDTRNSLVRAWDENQKLVIEKSVLITLLGQLKQEVADLKILIITLQQEFRIGNNQLSSLQQDMQRLLQSNEELILSVREGNHKENLLAAEVESLRAKLLNMESICRDLEKENGRILEERGSLTKQVRHLDEEKQELELENSQLVLEAVSLDTLSLVFKNTVEEGLLVIDQLNDDLNRICSNSSALENKVKIMEDKLDEVQLEKSNLQDTLKTCEGDLEKVTVANRQIQNELSQREAELLDAEAIKADQQKQILELSEKYDEQLKERELVRESVNDLDAEVSRTREKHAEAQKRVALLQLELQKGKDETELWETVAGSFFTELQTTAVREALFKEKFSELSKEYRGIEDENNQIKAQLAEYIPAFASLQDCVASLERHTAPPLGDHTERYDRKDEESGSGNKSSEDNVTIANRFSGLEDVAVRLKAIESSVLEMKKLSEEQRSQINSKLDETKALEPRGPQELSNSKLDEAKVEARGPQELSKVQRSGSRRCRRRYPSEIIEVEDPRNSQRNLAAQTGSFGSNAGDLMMKDIVLDEVSSGTPARGRHLKGYGESDDQILEMWQSIDQGGSIDYKTDRTHQLKAAGPNNNKQLQLDAVKQYRSRPPSSESLVEKEVGVDKLEISKRFSEEPLEPETKKKILERLASDIQKLTNLQITVDDLKQKVEITENSTSMKGHKGGGGSVEYIGVKDQLGEAEKSISKLLETNGKLVKKVESAPTADSFDASSSTSSSITESSEIGMSSRRRRVSEHAKRCSEKIGRLQLEVQRIRFLLLKFDGAATSSKAGAAGKGPAAARAGERNARVLLRDYLYGIGPRTPRRKRKVKFCACVQPPTSGD